MPDWIFIAVATVVAAVFVFVTWTLRRGEPVGAVKCTAFGPYGTTAGSVAIRRALARGSRLPTVQIQVRMVGSVHGSNMPARAALELAETLEAAAAENESDAIGRVREFQVSVIDTERGERQVGIRYPDSEMNRSLTLTASEALALAQLLRLAAARGERP